MPESPGKLALATATSSKRPSFKSSPTRSKALPDIPTVAESGYPGFSAQGWFGLFGPANLPREIVRKLNEATTAALHNEEVIERLARQGTVPAPAAPEDFVAFLKGENEKWAAIANSLGLKLD